MRPPAWWRIAAVGVSGGSIFCLWYYRWFHSVLTPTVWVSCPIPSGVTPVGFGADLSQYTLGKAWLRLDGHLLTGKVRGVPKELCLWDEDRFFVAEIGTRGGRLAAAGACEWVEVPSASMVFVTSTAPPDPRLSLRVRGTCGTWPFPAGEGRVQARVPLGAERYRLEVGAGARVQVETGMFEIVPETSGVVFEVSSWPQWMAPPPDAVELGRQGEADGTLPRGWTVENVTHDWSRVEE
jgi:hypothetical protein